MLYRCSCMGSVSVWEVLVFRHADVVCLCRVCIMWQSSMPCSA